MKEDCYLAWLWLTDADIGHCCSNTVDESDCSSEKSIQITWAIIIII